MMTLKLALLATTAAAAVAAAGGITYATVGNSSDAPSAKPADNVAAAKDAQHALPAPAVPQLPGVPTCLPGDLPRDQAIQKVKEQIQELAKKAPQAQAPANKTLPKVPAAALPKVPVEKLPVCKAGENGSKGKVNAPSLPEKPGLEVPAAVSCDKVPVVIKNEEARAKDFALPNGMSVGASHAHSVVIQSRAACEYTQELVGGAGQMISVDRIKTPPQVTLREMAESLKMPGSFVTVGGIETWHSPAGNGMLWYSDKGYAIRVAGTNPATAALVPVIASQLRAG